jgi:hypothetical protein
LCKAYFKRYFYNTTSARCEEFVYGGCGGNKNNFVKKEHCKAKCDNPGRKSFSFGVNNACVYLQKLFSICCLKNGKGRGGKCFRAWGLGGGSL